MKTESWLILGLGSGLLFILTLSFFWTPVYPKAVDRITEVQAIAFTSVISYMFGRSMPQQASDPKPGVETKTDTNTVVQTVSPAPVKGEPSA